jgi:hypothetical protein
MLQMPKLGPSCCLTISCECMQSSIFCFNQSFLYEDTEIHCVEIAVFKEIQRFCAFWQLAFFVFYNNFVGNIFCTFYLITRQNLASKYNGIGFKAIRRKMYTQEQSEYILRTFAINA